MKCGLCLSGKLVASDFLTCIDPSVCEAASNYIQDIFPLKAAPFIYLPIRKYCRPVSAITGCKIDVESLKDIESNAGPTCR